LGTVTKDVTAQGYGGMSVFTLTPGVDNFTGTSGETNTAFLTPSTLQDTDTITGQFAGPFFDILTITAGGTIAAAQFAGVRRFELINLASAGNSVALTSQLVAESSAGIFSVVGDAGNDTVNASGVTNGMRIAFYAGSGTDSFVGGNGNDYVEFATAELTAADSVNGGNGFDFLAFSTGGTVTAAALASVTSIEEVLLSNAGNSLTLSNAFVAGADNGVMSIVDGTGNDTIDASAVTNGIRVAYFTNSGNDTFVGGNGSDYLSFHADQLTSADHVTGGANYDIIEFDTAGTVAASAFTNVTGIDELILNAGGTNVTLTNAMVASTDNGVLVILDNGSGNDTINSSAVVSNRVVFQSNGGNDSFTGGGGSDVALFTAAGLTAADTFAGGTNFDVLQLTTAGTVGAAAFTNFTGVDELFLTLGGNTITLNGGVVANSDNGVFVVFDQSGNNTVNAGAATLGGRVVFNAVAGDHDTYTGGTGSDFFQFADANLNNTDTLAGGNGAGTDFLVVTTAASVTAADLANVTQMEVVQLAAGGSIALANTLSNSGSLEVDGTAAVDSIDGSGVAGYNILIKGGGGADTLKGGGGNDQVDLPDTNFVAIDGNGGFDKINLTSAFNGQTFDLTSQVSKITDVEAIVLDSAAGAIVNVAPGDISQINAAGNLLYIAAGSDDQINVSGTGWTQLETNHTNPNLPGHTFTHYHNSNGSDLYVDGTASTSINVGTPDVTDPVANPDVGTTVEDVVSAVSGNVLANDTDDNSLTVTTPGVFVGTYGNLSLSINGSYTYTLGVTAGQIAAVQSLAASAVQTDVFNYTITDGTPPNSSSTLTISVYGTNDAPTATAAVVPNATEDTAYSFNVATLFTDIDSVPSSDTLTYSTAGLPPGLSFAGSTISGTPTNDDVGSYTISVTANDGHSGSLTRTFSFSVANTNDAPVGTAASYTINEDTPLAGTVAGTDVDGNGLTFSLVAGSATNGVAAVSPDGTFTFTPTANFSGDATFQFRANDGTVNSAAQTVTIHVTPVNDAPVAAGAGNTASGNEDNTIGGTVPAGSDVDDATPTLTYELVAGPNTATEGALTFNMDGTFSFVPVSNFNGAVAFTYRVLDPHGAHSDPQTFTITVNPMNDAPVGTAASFTVNEDTPLSASVSATDADGNGLTYSMVAGSAVNGSAAVNPDGTFTFTPTANFSGDATFQFRANDGTVNSAAQTVTIHVTPVNDAPVAAGAGNTASGNEDNTIGGTVPAGSDVDDATPTLTYELVAGPNTATEGALTFNMDGTFSFVPVSNFNGAVAFTYRVLDPHGAHSDPQTFTITVNPMNDAPVGTAASFTVNEDTPLSASVSATDADGNGLTYSMVAGSAVNGSAAVNPDGTFTFTPTANFSGDATFQFRANDGTVNSAAQTVTIHVTPVNDAPTAAAAGNATSTDEDNAIFGNVPAGSDIDDATPTLTYELVAGPNTATEGSLTFNTDGSFIFSPVLNFNGAVAFTYRVLDPHGAHSDPQTFTITVDPVNDAPAAAGDSASIAEDVDTNLGTPGVQSVASGNLLTNDGDGDPEIVQDLDVTAVSGPGALTSNATTLTRTDADGTLVIDKETGAFTYTVDNSSATVQALGSGEAMSKVFTYTVTDDGVPPQSTTAPLTINIVGTNDGPVAVADTASVTEDSVLSASGNVLGPDNSGPINDSDVDGDTLTISAVNGSGAGVGSAVAGSYGSLTLNSGGSYTYNLTNANPAVQALGDGESLSDSFSYTVSDGHGGSATTTLTITVNGTNAAPTVSLGSNAALNDVASSSDLGVAIADAAATVTDEEARIKAIEVDISSGYQDGTATTGERAELSALGNFGLSLLGGSASFVDNGNHGTLTVTFAAPVSPANALAIFKQINYVNQIGDFSLAVALDDTRTVTVRVQDHDLAWSSTDTREVNVAANVLDGSGDGTFVGSRFADTINGADGNDTLTGGKGDDSLIGGNNTVAGDTVNYAKETNAAEVSETGTNGVAVNLSGTSYDIDSADAIFDPGHLSNDPTVAAGHAIDTYGNTDTLSGIENVVGTKYDDLIVDEKTVSNSYSGGETAETSGDVVAFNGTLGPDIGNPGAPYFRVLPTGVDGDDFTVQYFDPDLGPSGTVLATDTLTDIENMIFDNGTAASVLDAENPVWVIEDGYLVGTFTTVAAAVASANLLGGTTVVEIGHGTTPPADYDEGTISVTRAMTIKGIGGQQTIHATDDVDLFVVSGSATGTVRFENLALSDDGLGPTADYGIRFAGTYGVNSSANLQVSGVAVSGFEQNGVLVIGGGTSVNVAVDHSTFSGSGGNADSGGSGDLLFFEYTGAASLDHVTVTGTTSGTAATTADYGIQFAGFHDSDDAIATAIGNVSFDTVTVTGHYDNALVYIEGYNNLSGLSFAATTIGDAASTANWTGLYVEPKSTGGPFTPSGTTSTLDLTNVTLAGTYGWQTTFLLPGADLILGEPTNDHIIGSASNDAIRTLTGTDAIEAGGGNDLIVYDTLPGAKHTVDGGLGTDTEVVFGTGGAETFNVNAISGTQLGINILSGTSPASTVAATSVNYEVATTAVEQINIQTGNGGDNVVITGDLAGTGVSTSTITVIGGTGNDTVDASGMLNTVDTGPGDVSRVGIDFTGGAGNDTFISNSIGTNDRFDGGTNTSGDTVNYSNITGGGVSVHLGNQSATDIGGTGVGSDTLIGVENAIGSAQHDVLVGSSSVNTLTGGGGDDSLAGNAGNDSLVGGLGTDTADYSLESGTNGVTVDLGLNTATDTFSNTDTLTSIENATGTSLADTLIGGTGANVLTGLGGNDTLTGTGDDTLKGGANDDIYYAHVSDDVQENNGEGTDEVRATESYTLDANVENLTLLDLGASDTQDFENFDLGPITDGEHGWHVAGPNAARDQEVVSVAGNQMFRMSSDPSVADFAGPYSPELSATAGEPQTSADFNGQSIKFTFKPVDPTPDGSRLEVDFGKADGSDRNNFMVIESFAGAGIRIAVAEPDTGGNFNAPGGAPPTDWRELISDVDPTVSHTLEMRLEYVDGPNNDLINIYLDGRYIGSTTTFENYHDADPDSIYTYPDHATAAEDYQTDRVFFRPSANGSPQDGALGTVNKGFYFDNLTASVYDNIDGTGNDLANIITGNAGDNTLAGKGANDQLIGGAGIDTAKYDDAYSNYAVTYATDAHGFVTGASQVQETGPAGAVAEGTDTLTSIERLEFSNVTLDFTKRVQLFDGSNKLIGTFDHIGDAMTAASDGYTIRLAAGAFSEFVDVTKDVTIAGANSGTPGVGPGRGAESVLTGGVRVSHSGATIDGVKIAGIYDTSGVDGTDVDNGVFINAGNVTITNSLLDGTGLGDVRPFSTTGSVSGLDFNHNAVVHWEEGAYITAGGSGTIGLNTFDDDGNGVLTESVSMIITGNAFSNMVGSQVAALPFVDTDVSTFVLADNTFDANSQPVSIYPNAPGTQTITGTVFSDKLKGGDNSGDHGLSVGPLTFHGGAGNDIVYGSDLGDTLLDGGADNDQIAGDGGDDTLHGGGGNDALYGGLLASADAGKDTATYDNARANYTVATTTADGFVTSVTDVTETTVTGTDEGHDTLSGVEVLQFSDVTLDFTQNVQLFDSTGKLIGTFGTIQSAVNAAAGNAGTNETIRIREGVYTEQLTIDGTAGTLAGLTITGSNVDGNPVTGVTVKSPAVLGINGVSDHWGDNVRAGIAVKNVAGVTISNLTVDGSYAGDTTPSSNGDEITGIAYLHASGTVSGVHVEHTSNSTGGGLFGLQHGSGIFADNGTGTQLSLAISGSTIDTFQKTGILVWNANVDVRDNTVTGIGSTGLTAQNAMQIGGSSGAIGAAGHGNTFGGVAYTGATFGSTDLIVYEPTAALAIASNTFNGTGSGITVGLDLTDVDPAVTVTVSNNAFGTAGHGLYDGIDAYTFDGSVGLGSDPVMSGNTFTEITSNGIFLDPEFVVIPPAFATGTAFTETGSQFADVLHGSNGADNFSGGAGNDDLMGRLGVDIINGGAGDDTIAWRAGDGNDSIDGGNNGAPHDDQDTLNVAANGHNLTLTASGASFTVAQDDSPVTNTATVTEVEEVNIALSGGETITLVGDFTAAGVDVNSIVVDGAAGTTGETVDASGMTSTQHIAFTGGSGSDTFIESNAGGNDSFNGGGGVDTVDFSHETTGGITVDLSNTGAQNTVNAGTDTFTGVENAVGTGFADTITGSTVANMLVGGGGADTFTGGTGDDTIYGGTSASDTSSADKAIFSGSSAGYTITFDPFAAPGADGMDATVSGADGDDTLHGVELLQFGNGTIDLTKGVLLFDSGNHLIGTFDHIQDAVNAADGSGDTIKVRNGLYVEQVTIDATKDGLKIIGESESGVTVRAPGVLVSNGVAPSNGRNIDGVIVVDGADNVQVKTLTVDGDTKGGIVVGASNPTMVGVSYLNATGGLIDHVTVTHVREPDAGFGNQRNLGIFISNTNPSGSAPTTPSIAEAAALKTIEISHTTVTDFQKGGIVVSFANASIHDNTLTGHGLTGLTAQNGIQLAGSTGSVNGNTVTAIGYNNPNVAIGYAILTFNNRDVTIDGNHITGTGVGPTDSSGGIAAVGSTGVVMTNNDIHQVLDAMDVYATASFVDALAPSATSNPGGVFDFSSNAVDADVPFSVFFRPFATSTDTFVVTGTNRDDELHGAAAADTLDGGAGNDILDGRGGADTINGGTGDDVILIASPTEFAVGETIEGGANSDTIRFTSATANDTLTLSSGVTGVENVTISDADGVTTGTTALNVDASAVASALSITGNDGANSLTGTALADTLSGGGGNDSLTGGNGGDTIHGGSGLDTAVYTTAYAGHSVAWNGTTATVTGGTDTGITGDVIDTTGKLQFTDKAVWLVNDEAGSEYMTLAQLFDGNAANGEAADGDVIILDDGTYVGDVTVDKAVTILGANAGIAGTGSRAAEAIIEGQLFVRAGATIDGIEVHNTTNNSTQFIGVRIQNTAADVTVRNSLFYSTGPNGSAEDRGVNMDTTVSGHVTIANNLFTGDQTTSFGNANWQRGIWSDGGTSQLDITGNTLDHVRSGMNLDGLNNATTNVSGNTFLADGTGIAVGGNYVGSPAALSLTAIHDNFFNNTSEDLNVQNFTTAVSFDATATNNTATEAGTPVFFVDGGRGADTLTGTSGVDVLLGHALDGMVGNDSNTLTGKGGDDLLIGASGTGTDTAVYSGAITTANITATSALTDTNPFVAGTQPGWTVSGGAEGTDTLSEIEIVDGSGPGRILLVGNGGYATIAAALAAALDGDTILLAPGTYTENVTVSKDVTIAGVNHGIAYDGVRAATESQIVGQIYVHADGVTIDGVQITNGATVGGVAAGIYVDTDNVTITNSVFVGDGAAGMAGVLTPFGGGVEGLTLSNSSFSDWYFGTYFNPTTEFDATGNLFDDTALIGDDFADTSTITNNIFDGSGAGIGYGVFDTTDDLGAVADATNSYLNTSNNGIFLYGDGDAGGQTVFGTAFDDYFTDQYKFVAGSGDDDHVVGREGDDTFEMTAGNDVIDGGAGNDTLKGGIGNDTLNGGADADTLLGEADDDTLDGGAGSDTVDGGAGNDTVIGTADGVADSYAGGTGTDTIDYSALTSLQSVSVNLGTGVAGGAATGTDTLSGFENANGGAGNDSLFGSNANNVLHGGSGTDNIVGSGGSDQLFGDASNDTLNGGVNDFGMTPAAANDVLWGGADTDTFRFEGRFGDDAIGASGTPDWVDGEDMVFVGYAAHTPTIADVTGGVLISIDDGSVASSVFVAGATSAQMQQLISGADLIIH
jgi:VCBS repeat-containing protein